MPERITTKRLGLLWHFDTDHLTMSSILFRHNYSFYYIIGNLDFLRAKPTLHRRQFVDIHYWYLRVEFLVIMPWLNFKLGPLLIHKSLETINYSWLVLENFQVKPIRCDGKSVICPSKWCTGSWSLLIWKGRLLYGLTSTLWWNRGTSSTPVNQVGSSLVADTSPLCVEHISRFSSLLHLIHEVVHASVLVLTRWLLHGLGALLPNHGCVLDQLLPCSRIECRSHQVFNLSYPYSTRWSNRSIGYIFRNQASIN